MYLANFACSKICHNLNKQFPHLGEEHIPTVTIKNFSNPFHAITWKFNAESSIVKIHISCGR